jgi:DNA polymerase-3 subunit epsilon
VIRLGGRSRPWREESYAVLDFELTGLDLERDHVVSFGLVPVVGARIRIAESLYQVVKPPIPLPAESIRVHGIRPGELEEAPSLDEVAGTLVSALGGRELVAHASGIELAFLERLYRGHGGRAPRRAVEIVDLAAELLARRHEPPLASMRLAYLAERFGVPVTRTHHALGDALLTAELFLVLATGLESLGLSTTRDLLRVRRAQIA